MAPLDGLGYADAGARMSEPLKFSIFYGYPAELIAEWCCVSLRQARNLKAGKTKPSKPVVRLFLLHRDRRVLTTHWRGWVVKENALVDPDGNETTRAQLHGYWLIMQYAREIARERGPDAYAEFVKLLA